MSKILATTVDEEQWTDNDIRYWDPETGVTVMFMIPQEGTISWNLDDNNFLQVGQWTVTFEHPRPSIFSDIQICPQMGCKRTFADAAKEVQQDTDRRPQEVLAFKLVNGAQDIGTVGSYLKQQEWWGRYQLQFAKTAPAPSAASTSTEPASTTGDAEMTDEDIRSFCQSIKSTVVGLNLNTIDAGIVATAVRNSGLVSQLVGKRMAKMPYGCGHARID